MGMTDRPMPMPADNGNGSDAATTDATDATRPVSDTASNGVLTASRQSGQPLPHNDEAEQDLLGALLADNAVFESINDHLDESHFHNPLNGRIFAAMRKLHSKAQLANVVTLKSYFVGDKTLDAVDIETYLRELLENVTSLSDAPHYADDIYQCYLRRQLIHIADSTISQARTARVDNTAEELIHETEQKLFDLAEYGRTDRGLLPFANVLKSTIDATEAAHKSSGHLSGLGTGLTELNIHLGGLQKSDLLILAGRPGMGKTALATNIAFHIATTDRTDEAPRTVAFFSLEMSAEQLANRILSTVVRIPSDSLRQGKINAGQFTNIVEASQKIGSAPFFIDDTAAISMSQLASRARRLKRNLKKSSHELGLIVVDYLQLLTPPSNSTRYDGRVQEVSAISRSLKSIAKELEIPVLAVSQLSRAVEQRDDKQPTLSDLRESGSIEQDADVVLFVFREEYYLSRSEPMRKPDESDERFQARHDAWKQRMEKVADKARLIIAKQRHGPTGAFDLHFDDKFTEFSDAAIDDQLPEQRG